MRCAGLTAVTRVVWPLWPTGMDWPGPRRNSQLERCSSDAVATVASTSGDCGDCFVCPLLTAGSERFGESPFQMALRLRLLACATSCDKVVVWANRALCKLSKCCTIH